jgi:hypothetical protein
MLIVLFYSRGIMGDREFSWDGFLTWCRNLPANIKAWPQKHRAKSAARKEARAAKDAAVSEAEKATTRENNMLELMTEASVDMLGMFFQLSTASAFCCTSP